MSAFTSEPARSDDELFYSAPDGESAALGDGHDGVQIQEQNAGKMPTTSRTHSGAGDMDISASQKMMSATWGSILTSLLVTPLDVVRVRLQSQASTPPGGLKFPAHTATFNNLPPNLGVTACCREVFWVGDNAQYCLAGTNTLEAAAAANADCAVEETQRKTFTSTFDGLRKIARNEGPLTLWRGLSPTLLMAIPANVIYFTGYDWLRHSHHSPIPRVANDAYAPLVAGSVARVAAAIAVSPIEMFRTRMQATHGSATGIFKSTLVGLHQMTRTQGYTSLWRGLSLTMWRDVPFSGIYWWGYEAVRNTLTDAREKARGRPVDREHPHLTRRHSQSTERHTTTFIDSFVAGAASGAAAALVTTPFDVGKTRQQVYKHNGDEIPASKSPSTTTSVSKGTPKLAPEQLSMPRFLYHIFKKEGFNGLFKGWAARCLKVAPACAIMISSYEIGKKWARSMNDRQKEKGGP